MTVRETSREAYVDLRDTGKLGHQAQTILDHIQVGRDYSLQELSRITGIAINAVSGRVNGLKSIGLLVEADKRACTVTGRTIHPVRLPAEQMDLVL